MTFPSPRKLLFVVPVLAAVGVAVACGPYYEQTGRPTPATSPSPYPSNIPGMIPQAAQCPQITPMVPPPASTAVPPPVSEAPPAPPAQDTGALYYEPVTNAQGQTFYVLRRSVPGMPAGFLGTILSVVDGKIQVQSADGGRMTCEKLTLLVAGADPAEVSVADKLLKVTSGKDVKGGCVLEAKARKITRSSADGAQLILEGESKLVYSRKGRTVEANSEIVSVNLSTGQVVCELDAPKMVIPSPVTPCCSPGATPATCSKPVTSYRPSWDGVTR